MVYRWGIPHGQLLNFPAPARHIVAVNNECLVIARRRQTKKNPNILIDSHNGWDILFILFAVNIYNIYNVSHVYTVISCWDSGDLAHTPHVQYDPVWGLYSVLFPHHEKQYDDQGRMDYRMCWSAAVRYCLVSRSCFARGPSWRDLAEMQMKRKQ